MSLKPVVIHREEHQDHTRIIEFVEPTAVCQGELWFRVVTDELHFAWWAYTGHKQEEVTAPGPFVFGPASTLQSSYDVLVAVASNEAREMWDIGRELSEILDPSSGWTDNDQSAVFARMLEFAPKDPA